MLLQAATETARTSSYITGHFVVDGVLLIAGLKVVELVISKVRPKRNERTLRPGEGKACGDHEKSIMEQGKAIGEHGSNIAVLVEFKETAKDTLERIEGKLDRLIEKRL